MATVATVDASGAPRIQPTWVGTDGETIWINTQEGRHWLRRLRRDPRAALTIINSEEPTEYAEITAVLIEETTDGAKDHLDELSHTYIGADYPNHFENEVRIILKLKPEHVRYVNLMEAVPGIDPGAVKSN
jgi:PPOX class probable F420-dependent enzyme